MTFHRYYPVHSLITYINWQINASESRLPKVSTQFFATASLQTSWKEVQAVKTRTLLLCRYVADVSHALIGSRKSVREFSLVETPQPGRRVKIHKRAQRTCRPLACAGAVKGGAG